MKRSGSFDSKRFQAGFGLLETLAGLVVFMILAAAGTKAFKSIITNQRETAQVKALTDAVTVTAERLSAQSVASLTAPGSAYLQWSEPEKIGSGEYWFRFRTIPHPRISGAIDTAVVGLEVEVGALAGSEFTMGRSFATLIAPHLSSKDKLGQVSTALERSAEAAFYSGLQARLKKVADASKPQNQLKLNSYNCYEKEQCCPFMDRFFADPSMRPDDGMDEKCLYRCALGGAVTVKEWNGACGKDFCDVAPWKTKESCCAAIQAGECAAGQRLRPGLHRMRGRRRHHLRPSQMRGLLVQRFRGLRQRPDVRRKRHSQRSGAGLGRFRATCAKTRLAPRSNPNAIGRALTCCIEYWGVLNTGGTPRPEAEICKTISRQSECCEMAGCGR